MAAAATALLAAAAAVAVAAADAAPPLQQASFRLGVDDLTGPDWPARFANYSLFVCTPRFVEADLQKIRAAIPGAKLIAYFDTQFAMINSGCASSGGTPYYNALNRYFNASWAITNLNPASPGHGQPVCLQNKRGWAGTQPAGWVAFPAAVDAVARYHKEVTMNASWDGLYLDDAGSEYNPIFLSKVEDATAGRFDINGDGSPDSIGAVLAQWQAFRPYLFLKLREVVGPSGILLANSALPHAPDPSLSGITLESETCNNGLGSGGAKTELKRCHDSSCSWSGEWANTTVGECLLAMQGQALLSKQAGRAPLSVYWITEPQLVPVAQQCEDIATLAASLPSGLLYEGVDTTDTHGTVSGANCSQL